MAEIWRKRSIATLKNTSTKNSRSFVTLSRSFQYVGNIPKLIFTQPQNSSTAEEDFPLHYINFASFPGDKNRVSAESVQELSDSWASFAIGTTGNLALSSTYLLEYFSKEAAYDDADDNISVLF